VRHLAFDIEPGYTERSGIFVHYRIGLLPTSDFLTETHIDPEKLVTLELMIDECDHKETLHGWLRNCRKIERLRIRWMGRWNEISQISRYRSREDQRLEDVQYANPAMTANRSLIAMLAEDPELCPQLKALELEQMYTPDGALLTWIRARKQSNHLASIDTLIFSHCTFIDNATDRQLRQEIPTYVRKEHEALSRLNWKALCDEWDKEVEAISGRTQDRTSTMVMTADA
jgi:hypothetical protein